MQLLRKSIDPGASTFVCSGAILLFGSLASLACSKKYPWTVSGPLWQPPLFKVWFPFVFHLVSRETTPKRDIHLVSALFGSFGFKLNSDHVTPFGLGSHGSIGLTQKLWSGAFCLQGEDFHGCSSVFPAIGALPRFCFGRVPLLK